MAETLFDYDAGQSTDTFTDLTFPDMPATPQTLPAGALSRATALCGQFGLAAGAVTDACLVDVGITGDADFATEGAAAQSASLGLPNNAGSTAIGAPTTVTIDTPGATAVRTFPGTAGQKLTLTVTRQQHCRRGFHGARSERQSVAVLLVSSPTAFRDVFTLSVDRDVHDHGRSARPVRRHPDVHLRRRAGQRRHDGDRHADDGDDRHDRRGRGAHVPGDGGPEADPDGDGQHASPARISPCGIRTVIPSPSCSPRRRRPSATCSRLPVTGTYTITVDPRDQQVGTLTFTLNAVPDNAGTTAIGTPTTVTIGTIGEVAVRTFTATAGQKLTLTVTGNTIAGVGHHRAAIRAARPSPSCSSRTRRPSATCSRCP